jgi:predicted DNA-binding transcriptional regulator AlpA
MTNLNDKLLTRKEAAEFLGIKENTLAIWHCSKRYKLPVIKVGRLCKYRSSDLLQFLEERTNPNNSN